AQTCRTFPGAAWALARSISSSSGRSRCMIGSPRGFHFRSLRMPRPFKSKLNTPLRMAKALSNGMAGTISRGSSTRCQAATRVAHTRGRPGRHIITKQTERTAEAKVQDQKEVSQRQRCKFLIAPERDQAAQETPRPRRRRQHHRGLKHLTRAHSAQKHIEK